ncbi:hypothetical protein KKF91_06260 [Myxococcota bacterium]|nr:hypothetical protein [Myxococcota bacterium]
MSPTAAMPLADFYNHRRLRSLGLTFDVDWAPEPALRALIDVLRRRGLHATLFATHPSPALRDLPPQIEVAWHPFFSPQSSQGPSPQAALDQLRAWYPSAIGARTHCLIQSSPLLKQMVAAGLRYDSSLQLFDHPHLEVFSTFMGLARLPYVWSDAAHLADERPLALGAMHLEQPGLKILAWHPTQWFLNCADEAPYTAAKALGPLWALTAAQLEPLRRPGAGLARLFDDLCALIQARGLRTYTLRALLAAFEAAPRAPHRATLDPQAWM